MPCRYQVPLVNFTILWYSGVTINSGNASEAMADIVKSQEEGTAEPGVLQQSEQPFRLLVENAQDIIYRYRVSPRPGFEYLSPALTTLTGYTPEEGYADALFGLKLIHPDDWPWVQPYFQEQDKFGQCFSMRLVAKDGSLVWVEQTNVPIYDEAGRLVALEGISRDITRRVKTEEKLRESESRYSSLFETNHAVMLLIDPETGSIVDANPAACAYYSYSREDLSGKKISEINTLSSEQIFQEMQRAKTQERNHFHFRHRLASGEVRDVEVYSGPIRMHGRLLLYSIVHDVTESKRVEAALRRSEERFRQVIVSISAHIYVTEIMADGRRLNLYLSPHVEAMTGYPLERFTADWSFWPSTVIHPDDRAIAAGQAGRLTEVVDDRRIGRLGQAENDDTKN